MFSVFIFIIDHPHTANYYHYSYSEPVNWCVIIIIIKVQYIAYVTRLMPSFSHGC